MKQDRNDKLSQTIEQFILEETKKTVNFKDEKLK